MRSKEQMFSRLERLLLDLHSQGYDVETYKKRLYGGPFTYDALYEIAVDIKDAKYRSDWPYDEPSDWASIHKLLKNPPIAAPLASEVAAQRVKSAFIGSVCGCILGKPLEVSTTMASFQAAFEPLGEWPIRDYISEEMLDALGKRHGSWIDTCRGRISYAAADDDLNYSVLGMLLIEQHGAEFTHADIARLWGESLPILYTFGPERETMLRIGESDGEPSEGPTFFNPGNDYCGAMIRADAFGYACAGDPLRAAELACRDASFSHQMTGVYGAMFAAAAIAQAFVATSPLQIFEVALRCIPEKTRFSAFVSKGLEIVREAPDFLSAYIKIHAELGEFGHCQIYQESATLINTLRFAKSVDDGICKQVMQGNDTDSYGCTAGSILGAYFGPGHLDTRFVEPFHDRIQLAIARAPEFSLSALADRMSRLPTLLNGTKIS